MSPPALGGLAERVLDLAAALRRAGVPVALADDLDALRATAAIDLLDRRALREALAATMVKHAAHRPAYDTLFDLYFPRRTDGPPPLDGVPVDPADSRHPDVRDIGDFLRELVERVLAGDEAAIEQLAAEAVAAYGAVANRDGTTGFFAYRVFRQINLAGLLRRAVAQAGVEAQETLADRLARQEFEARLRRFREAVEAEVRRRLAAQRGADEVARTAVRGLPEDVDFFRISADEEVTMRRSVRPLARKLATRLAQQRRRARGGRLDVRRTIRASLGTGGTPIDLRFAAPPPRRPELVLLCDVSGSVAAFARFTLLFCHALQGQFSRVRSFAFIDTVDEVTRMFEHGDVNEALARLSTDARLVWLDGHSDYGHAFRTFADRYLDALTPRTTLLVLGDARNNYRSPQTPVLAALRRKVRHVYWLNPEPAQHWGTGDSVARDYAVVVDQMVECRNLRQLSDFVATLR